MIVMPANNTGWRIHYWQGKYGGLGQLHSPGRSWKPFPHLPCGLDNGAFSAYTNNKPWDEISFVKHCERILEVYPKPLWIVVPDVVADKDLTIRNWHEWEPRLRKYKTPLAFAVQDGMTIQDVPRTADVVFIGGSTEWKLANIERFCQAFPRVHVGRVNTWDRLWLCHDAGAESIDGTGWFRELSDQSKHLELYLQICAGVVPRRKQMTLCFP